MRARAEHLATGATLAVVGGYLDAYTFVAHDGVFANAQTGNVVFVAVDAARGQWAQAGRHLPIIGAFLLGLLAAEVLAAHRHRRWLSDPTRLVLAAEIGTLLGVAALPPGTPSLWTTTAVAFVAALQVTTFRLIGETAYSTTMTTGNLRTLVTAAYEWLSGYDRAQRVVAGRLAVIVVAFAGGAALGALASGPDALGTRATVLAALALTGVLVAVETHTRRVRAGARTRPDRAGRDDVMSIAPDALSAHGRQPGPQRATVDAGD
ncbi:YoaK family protein [Cellulomonas triticagri]|uniref:YoaK family protein n=1 Tax=Cellulomonas triticagri TaxID=2483352 RepID=UPI0013159E76|nr:YoaK family protein [Cellulomonas triticagri]